jgi:hypothetical protein
MATIQIADLDDSLFVELSLEESEAISGGWSIPGSKYVKRGYNYVQKQGYKLANEIQDVMEKPEVATVAGAIVVIGAVALL